MQSLILDTPMERTRAISMTLDYVHGLKNQGQLAEEYGISRQRVNQIITSTLNMAHAVQTDPPEIVGNKIFKRFYVNIPLDEDELVGFYYRDLDRKSDEFSLAKVYRGTIHYRHTRRSFGMKD